MRSSPIGVRPRTPFGYSGRSPSTSRAHGTTCSISARNLSRRVCFFLLAYSACEKLPYCGIGLSLITRQPILSHRAATPALLQLILSPDDQCRWLVLSKIGLNGGIKRKVDTIVAEEVLLNFSVAKPVQQRLIMDRVIRIYWLL